MAETDTVAFAQQTTLSFEFTLGTGNDNPTGITALNGKLYVVDNSSDKVYVYNADGTRDSSSDIDLPNAIGNAQGITTLNGKIWILDNTDRKVYVYNSDGTRASSSDFNLQLSDNGAYGITSLNGNLLVSDWNDDKVYAYSANGSRNPSSDITLISVNGLSSGITSLYGKLWVLDRDDERVYVYNSDGTRDANSDFNLGVNSFPQGITALNGNLWVLESGQDKVFVYDVPQPLAFDFDLDSASDDVRGITSLNNKLWVADFVNKKVYVYNADGTRNPSSDITLLGNNDDPAGITSLNDKLYVLDDSDDIVYAYSATDGTRISGSDFTLNSANSNPTGITAFNNQFYIVDIIGNKVYAYNAVDGTRDASSDFDLASGNTSPPGITALNSKFYVTDIIDDIVYVYNSDGTPDTASNFDLHADNSFPIGITSLHGKLWVLDKTEDIVYAYNSDGSKDVLTPDTTAPTLTAVTIKSNNSDRSRVATIGDIVTLRFTSSETILTPAVTINTDVATVAPAVAGSRIFWSATKTITADDNDGPVAFTIDFSDLADPPNAGDTVTDVIGGSRVVVDQTLAPPAYDFVLYSASDNVFGITSLNNKFWVADWDDDKVYVYNADGTRNSSSDITLSGNNDDPAGITSLNNKLYVLDSTNTKVYAYSATDGTRISGSDFTLDSANEYPRGITAFNNQFYIVDIIGNKVYAYNAVDGTRDASSDFDLASGNAHPPGITALNSKFYVADITDDIVYVYNSDGTPDTASNFDLHADNAFPQGITSLHGRLWVLDKTDSIVYAYNSDGSKDVNPNINLVKLNTDPDGITASTDGKLWVIDSTDNIVYAYNAVDGTSDSSSDINLHADNDAPVGITTLNSKFYILDSADNKVYAYNADGSRDSSLDIDLITLNDSPTGIAAHDGKLWVVDSTDTRVYAYNAATSTSTSGFDFELDAANDSPTGITALDGNLWVADSADTIVYAYNAADKSRISSLDFDLSSANDSPTGITTLDGKLWVADTTNNKIYSYNAPDVTAPTLDTVSIESNNSNDTSRATAGDIITLSFTSSEPIGTPTVTFGGVAASVTITGSNTSWSAETTITDADSDGVVTFTIDFSDLADTPNTGTQVIATKDGTGVTVDKTVPTLNIVSIESNNSDTSQAIPGDTVILSFESSETILEPTVTINGDTVTATVLGGDTTTWSAETTITAADADGTVTFAIFYSDLASNAGIPFTDTTDGTSVTVDQMAPILTAVTIESNNSDTSRATLGDIVTLSFTSDEDIETPDVTINGVTVSTVTGSNTSWSATKAITAGDNDGAVEFTIDYTDLAANDGIQITSITTGSSVTVDKTTPTLDFVLIESDNTNDTSLATTGNTVTLLFESSENILPPTVTFGVVAASTVTGSDDTWSATKTITPADADGLVAFTITFTDLASNDGTPVTGTIGGTSVTVDQMAPTLTAVSIASNNADPSRATTDDIVTLSFTSSENIGTPTVTFGGVDASATVTGSGTSWSATKIITSADADGSAVTFAIDFTDLATNVGTRVTSITTGSSVIVYQTAPDTTAPTLTVVSIRSDNSNDTTMATTDDTITLSFTSSEPIGTPTVTINTATATVTPAVAGSTTSWSATKAITAADNDGAVAFTIDFSDLADTPNVGTQVIATEDGTGVTVDKTAPTLSPVTLESSNADQFLAMKDDTITLRFTASEDIVTPVVTINGVDASATVTGSGDTWSATKIITAADVDGSTVTFTIDFTDLATNVGTTVIDVTADVATITVDQTVPTLNTISITSNNSDDDTLATAGNTVTLSFESSEDIKTPVVTINQVPVTPVAVGDSTAWSATRTITSSDADGIVAFTINYSDLASNAGVEVTGITAGSDVTVDNTAPTLTAVSITSNNSNDTTRATDGDTITLSFTSSENIETPTVTFGGVAASVTVTGSNTSWNAETTIASTDVEGVVAFSISYSDLVANDGSIVTRPTAGNPDVTVDNTAPTLTAVSIRSNNSNDSSLATDGNTITLSFTSSEPILEPTVTISGDGAPAVVTGGGTSWSATKTVASTDDEGVVAFSITYSDLATNAGTQVISVNDGTSVTVYQTAPDTTAPTLTVVSIESSNLDTSRATTGDTITLSFTSSEPIGTPTVTFGGVDASTVTGSGDTWSATKIITPADADGSAVTFAIDFTDLATNDGISITGPTDGTSVTVYQTAPDTTAPTLTVVSIESSNSNDPSRATTGNTVTLSFTSSENIGTPTVTFGGVAASVTVTGSNISWSAETTITDADADGVVTFTIDFSDLAATSNVGTQVIATKDGTSVTVDTTAPTLTPVSIVSDNTDTSRATAGNTVTLRFTSSEPIGTPTVTINGVTVSAVIGGDNTSWSATRIITPADADGSTVIFTINFTDLATNDGIRVTSITTGSSVTVYQTAPDTTAPTLTAVSIESDNSNDTSRAILGDTVTLSFTSSEPILQPTVTINGVDVSAVIGGDNTSWSAETTITDADVDGVVTFTIAFSNLASNDGTPVTDTTDNTGVTVDNTAPTRNSRGSDDDSKTRPTFGISGQTFAQIVNCGYSMDGVCTNVTEYHVDYNRQIIQTGTTHDFALKAYAQNGMKSFVIGFGVNEVGAPASESEASITVNLGRDYTLDSTYTIDSVEYDNDENVIGENATFAVSGVSCNGGGGGGSDGDDNDDSSIIQKDQTQCTQLLIDGVLFREAMYDEPFMIEAVDAKRKVITHYMNEGLQIIGESINEPPTHKFSSKKTSQSDAVILELVRTDKLKNIWTDQFGYTWSADTPDEWYYVVGPAPDNSSACDSMDHRVCDAFAEKLKYHTSKMESLRDSMYGDIYVAEPFDDLDEVVTFLMTPGESRTQFLDDNAMMWIRN